jgi:hypothetical protein
LLDIYFFISEAELNFRPKPCHDLALIEYRYSETVKHVCGSWKTSLVEKAWGKREVQVASAEDRI